jgi:RimJ/RimL family protein N-acetyltransferase
VISQSDYPSGEPSSGIHFSAGPASSARLLLRPTGSDDWDFLLDLLGSPTEAYRWRFRGLPPSRDALLHSIRSSNDLVQLVIHSRSHGRPIGLASAFAQDFRHGHCQIGVVVEPAFQNTGAGVEAGLLLTDYIFRTWPFRKIYAEAPQFTHRSVDSGSSGLFKVEATLESSRYALGRYWDIHIMVVNREDWEASKLAKRLLSTSSRHGDVSGVAIPT